MDIKTAVDRCFSGSADRSPNTIRVYKRSLALFLQMIDGERGVKSTDDLKCLSMEDFIEFPGWLLQALGVSKSTRHLYTSGSKYFLEWLVVTGLFEPTFSETLRFQKAVQRAEKKQETRLPRIPKEGHVEKMRATARTLPNEGPFTSPRRERDLAIIELLASSGCRNSEAAGLKIGDFDLDERRAKVLGKGSKERWIYFSQDASEALTAYWTVRRGRAASDWAFWRHDKGSSQKLTKNTYLIAQSGRWSMRSPSWQEFRQGNFPPTISGMLLLPASSKKPVILFWQKSLLVIHRSLQLNTIRIFRLMSSRKPTTAFFNKD